VRDPVSNSNCSVKQSSAKTNNTTTSTLQNSTVELRGVGVASVNYAAR